MSVNGAVVRITDEDLEWLRKHGPEDDGTEDFGADGDRTDGWFWSDDPRACELEKAYAAVHYLLTGTEEDGEGWVSFLGNQQLGEEVRYEFAYGPGRAFEPDAVQAIAAALDAVPQETLLHRLYGAALGEVYPFSVRGVDVTDEDRHWAMVALEKLRTFMRTAAAERARVLVAIL